jgi:hypothetical protein
LSNSVDFVILANVRISFSENPAVKDLQTSVCTVEFRTIASATGDVVESYSVSQSAAGFNKQQSQTLAFERVVKGLAGRDWRKLTGLLDK